MINYYNENQNHFFFMYPPILSMRTIYIY